MNLESIELLFQQLKKSIPNPTTELNYSNPFELFVAVVLSAQTTDQSVNKVTPKLFSEYPTSEKMADAGEEHILDKIKTLGLSKSKAKYLSEASRIITEKHKGKIPDNRKDLEDLPGVGRKTANVLLNTLFHEPVIAVDTHVLRVANRTGLAKAKSSQTVEKQLVENIPEHWRYDAHHYLILHGRYICKSRKPDCSNCVIKNICEYNNKTIT